ncbi:MAG: hypothetical protein K6360_07000 [Deltaproteobacteria bacterium]
MSLREPSSPCETLRSSRVPTRLPAWVPWAAFAVGLTGAISLRLILVAKVYRPELIRLFWYIGVVGNMVFFLFRTFIIQRRRRLINEFRLLEKLESERGLGAADRQALRYLVASLSASKELWNYLVITVFSLAAIFWDLFHTP